MRRLTTLSTGSEEHMRQLPLSSLIEEVVAPHRDFEFIPLNATPIIGVVAADHPLAARRTLSLAERKGGERDHLSDDEIERAIDDIQTTIRRYRR